MELKTSPRVDLKEGILKQQECVFIGCPVYSLTDHVRNTAVRNVRITDVCFRAKDPRLQNQVA
jgi:hypothetical protein